MKKFITSGIIIALLSQLIIVPMGTVNIANAAPVEQKSFLSLIGKEANYKSLFDKILAFDMTSQMLSRQDSSNAIIRSSGKYVRVDDVDQTIKSGTLDLNGSPVDIITEHFLKVKKSISVTRNYSYNESIGTPGITDSQKYNETDDVYISGMSSANSGIGRVWVASGAVVTMYTRGTLGYSSKYTVFYQWGKPIDHTITQAAHNEMQRYSMGYRDLPLAPIVPAYNGTPMAFLNDESQRVRDESYYMKDGREISDAEMTSNMFKKILGTEDFQNLLMGDQLSNDFYNGSKPYFGQICGYNEGPCGGISVRMFETLRRTRAFPTVGGIRFTSNRSGWLYYDVYGPESNKQLTSWGNLQFNVSSSTLNFKAALKSVIWDSRGDPCEAADVTTDPVCKVVYGQTVAMNSPLKLSLRAESGTSSNTYYSDTLADSSDIKIINVQNGKVALNWIGNNATLCTLNGNDIGTSGTQTFTGLTNSNTVHYLKCVNSSGKIASLYFKVEMNSQDCFAPGSCGQGLPPVVNPYSSYISNINQQKLTKWLSNLALKSNSLGLEKYSKLIETNTARLRIIIRITKNTNTSIMAKYLIFELQQIQDKIDEDSLFNEIQ